MDRLTERQRWGLVMVMTLGAVCGATAVLLRRKRETTQAASHEADLDARKRDMVAEGGPDSAQGADRG